MKKVLTVILALAVMLTFPVSAEASVGRVKNVQTFGVTSGTVKLKWKKVKGATAYQIYKSGKRNSGYIKAKTVSAKRTKAAVKSLKANKTYYFKVRAVKKKKKGNFSSVVTAKTKKPFGTITGVKSTRYTVDDTENGRYKGYIIDFNKVKGCDGYEVYIDDEHVGGYSYLASYENYITFATYEPLGDIYVRAYKNTSSSTKYGAWKKVYGSGIKTKKAGVISYREWILLSAGGTNINI